MPDGIELSGDLGLGGNTDPTPQYSEFAQGILNQIPEADRNIVGKYIGTWDGNVTKQFQKIHDQYKPYKDLGPVEDIQQALQYVGLLNDNPKEFVRIVQEAIAEMEGTNVSDFQQQPQGNSLPEFEGLPPQFVEQFNSMRQTIENLNGWMHQQQQSQVEQQQTQQFDDLMEQLHTTHGKFDDHWVALQIANGVDPSQAVKNFQEMVSSYNSQNRPPAPITMPGAGSVPNGQVDYRNMPKDQRNQQLAALLQAAANG